MSFPFISGLRSNDLAIDLGTANTLVYAKGRGVVLSEPSIVAINKVTNTVEAVGKDAKEMLGRTPGNIVAIRPMWDGVIANFEVTEKMLQHFIRKAHNGKTWVSPRVVIGIPSEITQVSEHKGTEKCARPGCAHHPCKPGSAQMKNIPGEYRHHCQVWGSEQTCGGGNRQ